MGGLGLLILLLAAPLALPLPLNRGLKYVTETKTWQDAKAYCEENHLGLAVTKTQAEWSKVVDLVMASDNNHVWLGHTLDLQEDCVSSHGSSSAHTWGCTYLQPFICFATVTPVFYNRYNVVMQSNGSLDMNDPYVQEALLTQMENRLRDQGVQQPLTFTMKKGQHRNVLNETLSDL